jgi:ABC-type branched-subunit amino acid transport system substrate-binding protein
MTTRTWLLTASILAALLLAAACSRGDTGDTDGLPAALSPTADRTPQVSGDVLTIEQILQKDPAITKREELVWGVALEDSGILAGFGQPVLDGLEMAVQQINDAGGFQVGDTIYTIKLVQRDTRSDAAQTIAVTTELVVDEGVDVLWGPASIGDPESTVITQQAGVLHICPCPRRELTSLKDAPTMRDEARYAFQTLPAPSKFLPPAAVDTKATFPELETFATMCATSITGRDFCDYFTEAYEAAGFEHVTQELFPPETTDFSPFLTNVKEHDPDIILNFVDAGPEQFQLLKQSWQLDVGDYYIAVELPYDLFESLVGGEGIREKRVAAGAAPRGHAQYTSERARAFFEEIYKPFADGNLPPAAFAALLSYDPAFMLLAAMQQAGSVDDVEAITAALEEVHFNGVGEDDMYFDERHVIVTGTDSCQIYQGTMTCEHNAPPVE